MTMKVTLASDVYRIEDLTQRLRKRLIEEQQLNRSQAVITKRLEKFQGQDIFHIEPDFSVTLKTYRGGACRRFATNEKEVRSRVAYLRCVESLEKCESELQEFILSLRSFDLIKFCEGYLTTVRRNP